MSQETNQNNKRSTIMHANPLISKIGKIQSASYDGECVSYDGILRKTLFFVALTVIGYALFFIVRNTFTSLFESVGEAEFDSGFAVSFSIGTLVFLLVSLVICLVAPIVASSSPKLAPVFGGIYSIVQGVMIATISEVAASRGALAEVGGGAIAFIALVATALIVLAMGILYKKKIIQATARFKGILMLTAGVFVLLSIVVGIMALIPATHNLVAIFYNNPVLSIGGTIIGIIFASLFLISDFDTIDRAVEMGLEKKYEWTTAFGLVLTILWLYFKILQLIIKVFGSKK